MTTGVCKFDKIAHEIFASTLRAPYTSPRDAVPDSKRLKYADIVAALAKRISEPRTLKLNLLLLPGLKRLSSVEADFLKAAVPVLICAARPYNNQFTLDHGSALLFRWAGCGNASVTSPSSDVTELLISPHAFKNTLLKLLNGNSDDYRIVSMRKQVSGEPWTSEVEGESSAVPTDEDDEAECTFKPKLNKYPKYLSSAPRLAYPPKSLSGQLKKLLDMPPRHSSDTDEIDVPEPEQLDFQTDYGSPFNNTCPLGSTFGAEDLKDISFGLERPSHDMGVNQASVRASYRATELSEGGAAYNLLPNVFSRGYKNRTVEKGPHDVDAEIEAIMASLPSMKRPVPPTMRTAYNEPGLRFVSPLRNHLCTTVGPAPDEVSGYPIKSWQDQLRGGFINTGMKFFAEPERTVSPSHGKYVGSLKQCDYVLPHNMGLPLFSRRAPGDKYHDSRKPVSRESGCASTPLDILEAQLAKMPVNIRKMIS
ncbi:uncharacterized protein BXIN_2274 [Babesia sp. Xinjiang]|uniref:uncharacterized protein n=1 Tax=Babesia sp. Xinjiang TaxID=462227 RepID=UPI000A236D52|nr:uncharacterized protein BXIN_2274 [Babesia sp. Xinjiang]ORM40816.1 hypothetical protein BXIN_2274 [Babesia sp. Xinjiang]